MKKILAIFTLTGFLCSSVFGEVLHAAAGTMADAAQFKPAFNDLLIPPACGRITDTYIVPAPEGNSAKMPLVINIQDLHCHAEVQRNIAKILAALDSKYGLNKVYVEGGYGTVDTSWLCSLEDKGLKKEIVEKLIDQGKLTGSEVYSITANRPDVLQGLEDKSLHQQNIVRLGKILAQKAYFETEIKGLERDLELMKAKYFTVKNRKFNDVVARHRNGELSSNKYYLLLTSYAETINRNPDKFNALLTIEKSDYPEIYNYAELIRISKELNYRRISRQLQEFMQVLKSRVPYNVYNALLEKTDNFSRTDELYLYLTELSETPGLKELRRDYPDLYRFFTYTRKNRSINPVRLIDEEKRLVEEIRIGLSKDVSELEVAFLADFFGYFQDYLLNRLSADDYAYFVKRFDKFQKLWGKYAFRNRVAGLSKDFPLLNEYYEVNAERNELFLQHIAEIKAEGAGAGGKTEDHSPLLSESVIPGIAKDATVIVMVTGGFHTEGLKKLFRERAVSYLTITPNITSDAALSDHVYTEMAKRQAKLFSGQALALALGSTEARIVSVGKDRIVVSLGKDEITLQREGEQQPFKLDKGSQKLKGLFDPVQLEAAVNEAVRIAAKIEPMPNPALRSTLILELVKVFSVSAVREGIFFGGNGLIWSIATNDKVLQIIEKRGGVSADELSQLPDSIQELIEAYSLQEEGQSERARGNALISAILQVPELKLYIASKAKALKEQQSRGKNNDAGGALTAGLSYAFGGWLFEALWGKPLPADDAGRARIKRASELLASFNPFDILPLHLWEMATGRSEATPKRILGTTMILGAAAAAWHLALGIGMIYIIHSLTHLAYNLAVPGEPLTAGGGHKRDEKLTRIKGYKEYGEAISTYYRARRQLVEAIGNRDINAYTTAYDTFFRSAKAVKEAYQNNELDLQALVETMQKEGLLVTLSYKDAQGNEFSGPWDEILKIGGETFSEKHHRWITESIDTLIQAFPKSQQKAVEAVREKIIKNTFAFSGEHLIPSPDRIRQAMDQATGDAGLQSIREFLLESLTDAAEFKYGFTLPFQAEPEIVMHALKEEDWFRAVYMHEIGHYLFRTGIIDLPQMEIITHAISSIWLGGSDYPELFASGIAWAEKNRGKEISVNELEQVSYEGVVTNWAALGFSSMGTAMQVPHLVQSGQIEMEDYQRWVGAALGGVAGHHGQDLR
jgi:hypothetical protein